MTDNSNPASPDSLASIAAELSKVNTKSLSRKDRLELLQTLEELERRQSRNKFQTLFPDKGPFRRELYPKQLEFFKLGKNYNERLLAGGNRSGKSLGGGFEMTCHLTGLYPEWWEGKKFDEPIAAWTAGDTAKSVRDIMQTLLVGPPGDKEAEGTGLIPGDLIVRTTPKHGLADSIESCFVRHISGGTSTLQFKSYDQGRVVFQGTSQHVIHLDEECAAEIYTECLLRTMTVDGIIYVTATPLLGLTDLMLSFMPEFTPTPEDFK